MLTVVFLNQLGNGLFMMFGGASPKISACGNHSFSQAVDIFESCAMLKEVQQKENCTPEFSYEFKSVNIEWNYYCDTSKIVKNSITYQTIGLLIGSLIYGQLSDSFGRKPALLSTLVLGNVFMLASSFTNSLFWFTVMRFFVSLFMAGSISVIPIYSLEILPPKDRYWINNIGGGSPVIIFYAIIAYCCGEWKLLARTSAALALPAIIVCLFVSESPRYLIQKGKMKEAKAVLKRIFRIDRREFDDFLVDHVLNKEHQVFMEKQANNNKYTLVHLFYTPDLTRYSLSIAISFFTTSLMTSAIFFNIENIAGSAYMNLMLTVATCLMTFVVVIATGNQAELSTLLRIAALIILGFIAQMYLVNGICATELFPTCIRNISFSFGQLFNRLGVVLSPQVFFLADYWKPLPYFSLCLVVLLDMVFFQVNVTETKNNPLGDHMPGPEESWSGRKKNKKNQKALLLQKPNEKVQKLIENENV
uniref:Major facilitator superfamily (MFS) profile domain-containing protein n=1 Tax=Acrobeloides nanus TaxID=290746 RepID=A0A914EJQ0_9BILA